LELFAVFNVISASCAVVDIITPWYEPRNATFLQANKGSIGGVDMRL
jgi:hypothetical protein